MYAYKSHIIITPDKKLSIDLPPDMPEGEAELILLASDNNIKQSADFDDWFNNLLDLLPAVKPGHSIDCSRESIYSDRI